MTRATAELLREALELTPAERLDLAAELLATVDGPADADWERAWGDELERRADEADLAAVAGDDWAAVRARVLSRGAQP